MAHKQSIDWNHPESVPYFFLVFWSGLPYEAKRKIHQQLYPFFPIHAQPPAQGDIRPTTHAVTSFPTIQYRCASATSPDQQTPCREPAEKVLTPQSPLEPSFHDLNPTNPSRRKKRRLPCTPQLSDEPLITTSQQICPQRSTRDVATAAVSLPAVTPKFKTKDPTKNLPHGPAYTLKVLCQPPRQQPSSVTQAISSILSQLAGPHSQPLFSAAEDDLKKEALASAAGFFYNHGRGLEACKDIVENHAKTDSTLTSAAVALRFHPMAVVFLRDHLVECARLGSARNKLTNFQAKGMIIKAQLQVPSNKLTKKEVTKKITDELARGMKYKDISQQFSASTVARLNSKCISRYEVKLSSELVDDLTREGAKTSHELQVLAKKDRFNEEVKLEVIAAGCLLWVYYQYHITLFPDGCGWQDCHWRKTSARPPHEPETEFSNETQVGNITTDLPSSSNSDNTGNESTASPRLSLDTTVLGEHNMPLLLPASAPAIETSLRPFPSRSRKRTNSSEMLTLAMAQLPTDANYGIQRRGADALFAFQEDDSTSPPSELNSDDVITLANCGIQHGSASEAIGGIDDSGFDPTYDILMMGRMPSYPSEFNSDGAPASGGIQHGSSSEAIGGIDDSGFDPTFDTFMTA
ncbi:hypothetical protein BBO_09197 [Beauveria brongniartii RCEF 3172]|uniref:Uncharacterized protein n=1 Tax=Beauveria brongniartii RCEF 3172 TaxID=1081107 RepID=A0A166W7L2_9HYPO|nr:hypothetical protein BBO_09197 [Beauveria brongniartii RCEF 3172]